MTRTSTIRFALLPSVAFVLAVALPCALPAQTAPKKTASAAGTGSHRAVRKPITAKQAEQPAAAPVPVTPAAPAAPKWPANEEPKSATVTWDSRGLGISASNSSLNQILKEVATDTGAKLSGLGKDQRIFGSYGPGPAREVLSKLLDGSGYNVLLTGGQGGAPLTQIVLSVRGSGSQQPQARTRPANEDEDADDEEATEPDDADQPPQAQPQQQPAPARGPFGGGMRMGFPENAPSAPQPTPGNQPDTAPI